jgi:hypothetical protein
MSVRIDRGWTRTTVRAASIVAVMACVLFTGREQFIAAAAPAARYQAFDTAEHAVQALGAAVKAGNIDGILTIFGPDAIGLIDTTDLDTARRNLQVFTVAMGEGWRLVDQGSNQKALIVGNEHWPFPVPLVKGADGWRFDTAAGKEEVLSRRIGGNELAAIRTTHSYVAAQRRYAQDGHDGNVPGLYAKTFRSDPGKENGLYWAAGAGRKRSPLGDLMANAAAEGQRLPTGQQQPSPFRGYFFKILTAQGKSARGGARSYLTDEKLVSGFALVAWPAQYGSTGIMTFIVNQDGVVQQKDLGPETDAAARGMTQYNPDSSWKPAIP